MAQRALPGFLLDLPDGFAEQPDAPQGTAFRSAAGEELVLVAAALDAGPEAQQRIQRDRLVQGALKDVQRAACQPDLEVLVPLSRAPGPDGLETWHLVARSPEGRLFAQAVAATPAAVAVLTFDGRNERPSIARWFALVESLRPVPSPG